MWFATKIYKKPEEVLKMDVEKIVNGFLERNVILIDGDITVEKVFFVKRAFAFFYAKGSPDITVMISSQGGDVDSGLNIYDILKLYPGKKTALVVSYAKSMAAVILQACDIRKACEHAGVLIHNINRNKLNLSILKDKKKMQNIVDGMEKSQEKINRILAKRTKRSIDEIRKECKKEKDMSPEEAIRFGLLDGIWEGPLPK